MAARPTPFSIALSALIALHCETLYLEDDGSGDEGFQSVDAFLQDFLTTSSNNSGGRAGAAGPAMQWASSHAPPVRHLVRALQKSVGPEISGFFLSWLQVAATSINALTDLMTTIYRTVREGVVDASSVNGMYVRSVCLGFEQLSFESTSLLWTDFRSEVEHAAMAVKNDEEKEPYFEQQWPLSAEQMEGALRNRCLETSCSSNSGHGLVSSSSLDEMQNGISHVLESDPELPSAHFLRFLHCLQAGERVGAMEALHQYFDYALIQKQQQDHTTDNTASIDNNNNNNNSADHRQQLLQFAAILLAAMYNQSGDDALSLLATEEAVRVAQQSQDTACVAFALGWLFENEIGSNSGQQQQGTAAATGGAAGELIQRCVQRAVEGNLRALAAGSNLTQVRHLLTLGRGSSSAVVVNGSGGGGGHHHNVATLAWTQLMDASTDPTSSAIEAASTNHPLDRPTHMAHIASGDEALEILTRQRMVAAAIWDAFGQTASSGLASFISLYCQADHILPSDVICAVQNIARVSLCGSVSSVLSPRTLEGGVLYKYASLLSEQQGDNADKTKECVYADALMKIVSLRKAFHLPVKGSFSHDIALILHEWAVRRGDYPHAEWLMLLLQSDLHPGMANYIQAKIDVYMQKCLLRSRQGQWDEAKRLARSQIEACTKAGLHAQQARLLIQLALMHLESAPPHQFTGAMPSLLECLTLCDKYGMHGIHAVALSILGQVHLRMHNPKQAIAVLQASLPTILQEEHVWYQAETFLTLAKCRLARAKEEESNEGKAVPTGILRSACKDLSRSEELFRRCHDGQRLQEIYYLQARVFNSLPNGKSERDQAAQKFLHGKKYLTRAMAPVNTGFEFSSDADLERLATRSYPLVVEYADL